MNFISSLANPMQHCEDIVWILCKSLNIKVTKTTVQKDLTEHPDYPSLLPISDVIKNYGIENVALMMKRENLGQLGTPFIAHVGGKNLRHDLFAIVHKINNNGVELYHPESKKNQIISVEEFDEIYKGTVLVVEAGEHTGEKDYEKKKKAEKRKNFINTFIALAVPAFVIIASIIAFVNDGQNALSPIIFTLLTLAGCIIGILLLWHEVDAYNPVIKEICQGGKKVNCSAILNSNAAKVLGISWSVLGSTYFIGMLLSLLVGGITNTHNLFLISWLNVLALPYIIYSISYQYFVAKQWCVLCLAVQGILFLQFVTAFLGSFHSLHSFSAIPAQAYITIAASFIIVFVTLLLLMPAFEKAKDSRNKTISLQRLKHNPQIFEALLAKQKSIGNTADGLGIIIGNPNAKYRLTKVCNPYCDPCSKAHSFIEKLLEYNVNLQVQIIFMASDDDYRTPPARQLMAIYETRKDIIVNALHDWYSSEDKNFELFSKKYSIDEKILRRQDEKLISMHNWCLDNKIYYTPTLFIGEHRVPKTYSVSDLIYFLTE